eukprot:CAMPEP_0178978684 /NCGR_PEP_ID=MMETSP0789-20121207/25350_1 /TAXON_ID=3005 /ORGANISM="Rhizosolenia setigera, Strain CCMP 1694" /LENGTH=456 /DNA_ID=CAMNT_0020668559 /DNA_START=42 /DNA_END=1412 /DNA_ORIENTATION=+
MLIRARNITNNQESHLTTPLPLTIDNDNKKRRKKGKRKRQLLLFLLLLGVCLQVIIPIGISFSITNSTDFKEVKKATHPPKYNDIIPASSKCSSAIVHDACSRRTLPTASFNIINVTDWEDTLPPPVEENSKNVLLETGCKTLWFSGFLDHESVRTDDNPNSYPNLYSAALNSALRHAGDVLQPVLMMGRFGSSRENPTAHEAYGRWAESKGTKVIYVPKLTFHDLVADRPKEIMSAFMRLDIPTFVKEHKLLDMPGVCQRHVFYTDADVIFANPLLESDILMLKQRLEASEEAILSYGREGGMHPHNINTGVMMIDLKKFEEELPLIFDHGRNMESPPEHDQELLNHYFFGDVAGGLGNPKLDLLPIGYNWKPYWHVGNASGFEKNVKIVHTHGPKPGRGLEKMSTCDFDFQLPPHLSNYIPLIENGICFDQGRVSRWTIDALKYFKEPSDSWSR